MRFEQLQQDFNDVCDIIGRDRTTLPHNNRQDHHPYQDYFKDPIDRDLFLRHFQRDVDTFEYEF